jgi:hypothetical protein
MNEEDKEQAQKAKAAQNLEIQKQGVAKTLSRLGFGSHLRRFGALGGGGAGASRAALQAVKADVAKAAAVAPAAGGDAGDAGGGGQQQAGGVAPPPLQVPEGAPGGDGATPGTARTGGTTSGTPLGSTGGTPGSQALAGAPGPQGGAAGAVAGSQEVAAANGAARQRGQQQPGAAGNRPQSIQGLLLAERDVQSLVQPGSAAATAGGDGRIQLDLVDFMEALARDPHASHGELLYRLYGTAALSPSVGFMKPTTGL